MTKGNLQRTMGFFFVFSMISQAFMKSVLAESSSSDTATCFVCCGIPLIIIVLIIALILILGALGVGGPIAYIWASVYRKFKGDKSHQIHETRGDHTEHIIHEERGDKK